MRTSIRFRQIVCGLSWIVALACVRVASAYVPPPSAPTGSASGAYAVTWSGQCSGECLAVWLEERVGSGAFNYVGTVSPTAFAGKAAGQYTYRVAQMLGNYYVGYYGMDYSAEVTVTVGAAPPLDPLLTQRGYQYQTRVGDLDYDGRRDLYIQRVSGGVANSGVLDRIIVQQTATPGQYALVPPTPAQVAAAAAWPVSSAQVAVEDINVDGFVDVTVKGVAGALGVPGAANLIVYSPGVPFSAVPKGLRTVDAGLLQFVGDMLDYEVDSGYFANNAPYVYYTIYYSWSTCSNGFVGSDVYYWDATSGCITVYQAVGGYYQDYSGFSSAAVAIADAATSATSGQSTTTAAVDAIDRAAEGALKTAIGGWRMEEVLGTSGEHTNSDARRAMEVIWSILGVARAEADEVRTTKAPAQVPRVPGTIYVTKRALGTPWTLHVALEYTSPVSVFRSISAYDSDDRVTVDGRLISEKNWFKDVPALMMTVSEVRRSPAYPSNDAYWLRLLAADTSYVDGSLAYDLVPSVGKGGYNCASYAHGILNATGGVAVNVPESGNWTNMWGWGVPVPPASFN
ncbi:MAG TPA: hypothetical protein VHH11_09710 [Gammaproteobacteria bacterium]|nr:hypothetical protein [Gammaproteobacteria bacterium]